MIRGPIIIGQQFRWTNLTNGKASGTAIVRQVRSDKDEGMSTELEDYVAQWIQAEGRSGDLEGQDFTVILGTDGNSYVQGQKVAIEII